MVVIPSLKYKVNSTKENREDFNYWVEVLNKDYKYCSKFNLIKWSVYYFYKLKNNFHVSDLPSYHPYWKGVVRNDVKKIVKRHKSNIKEIKKDSSKLKYFYSSTTNIEDVYNIIDELEKGNK